MTDYLNVSVIIPNYNGEELLANNIPSLIKAFQNKSNNILEIIIVDDNSKDKSIIFLKNNFPQIKIIKHKVNRGFAASVNTGVRSSKGKLICLLNTDVSVSNDFLISVFNHFKNINIFGVSFHEKGYGWAKGIFKDGFILHKPGIEDNLTHNSFWVSGGSGIFRKDLWVSFGGFDERLFKFYWEDVDIAYRAQKRGYILIWDPNAHVEHKHELTTGKKYSKRTIRRMQDVNQIIFIWKNLTSPSLFKKHILGLVKRISKHPGFIIIVVLAILKLKRISWARKKEKKETKVSDEAIFAGFADMH